MTETSISLLSIICGIGGAVSTGLLMKDYSLGLTGNAIAGVFGSILFIKTIGRTGIDATSIMTSGSIDFVLLTLNLTVSAAGGLAAVFIAHRIKIRYGKQ